MRKVEGCRKGNGEEALVPEGGRERGREEGREEEDE